MGVVLGLRAAQQLRLTLVGVFSLAMASAASAQSFNERFAALDLADTDPVALSSQPGFISSPRPDAEEIFRGVKINPPADAKSAPRAPPGLVSAYAGEDGKSPFNLWAPRLTGVRETPEKLEKPRATRNAPRNMFAKSSTSDAVESVEMPQMSSSGPIFRDVSVIQAYYIASKFRPRPVPGDLADLIAEKAKKHGVPLQLAHAVVAVESNYNPNVTGRASTIGLMQIKHQTARGVGFSGTMQQLYDPATNLEFGMKYLGRAHKMARGDICGTIMRYQGGHYAKSMSADAVVYCAKVQRLLGKQGTNRVAAVGSKPGELRGY
jgi:soluble lytic murein transglycosylase-like protein